MNLITPRSWRPVYVCVRTYQSHLGQLLQNLGEKTLVLNREAILEVIERIEEHAPDTAENLRALVQNFEIERIRELLNAVEGNA